MQQSDALAAVRKGTLHPVYFVHGGETFLETEFLGALHEALVAPGSESFNFHVFDTAHDQIVQAVTTAITPPFFANQRLVVVRSPAVLAASRRKDAEGEEGNGEADRDTQLLLKYLAKPIDSTCLVFVHDNPDLRKKISKLLSESATVVECRSLTPVEAVNWSRSRMNSYQKKLGDDAARMLVERVGTDLLMLDTELSKLSLFVSEPEIHAEHVDQAVSGTTETEVYKLTEAVMQKQPRQAMACLKQVLRQVDHPLQVLGALSNQYRLLLSIHALARQGVPEREGATRLKIHQYRYQVLSREVKRFSRTELRDSIDRLLTADVDMKTGSDPQIVIETLVMALVG